MKRLTLALAALTLAIATPVSAQGTGWSRAPDLSVYGAMTTISQVAREESLLCAGFSTASVMRRWQRHFGDREAVVTAALVDRYGAEAVQRATTRPSRRVPCPPLPYGVWWGPYEDLLVLLERRLGLS